jgi:predicted anti-sigma-YlaC factor YlaD
VRNAREVRDVDCRECTVEIVECARVGSRPAGTVEAHLHDCAECRERWETEQALSQELMWLRAATASERSSAARRAQFMQEFSRLHRPPMRRLHWAFAAAAAVLFALALELSQRGLVAPTGMNQIAMRLEMDGTGNAEFEEISGASGFVAIPYAPPLATGEFVKVVRTQLYAAALDRMGVSVPAGNGEFPAEVVMGEDGLPRAVRVLEDVQF